MEKDLEILEKFINNHLQRDKFEIDSRCGGFKMGKIYKLTELNSALEHLIQVYKEQQAELEKKDKIIDLMSKQLYIEGYCKKINCKKCKAESFADCIKQYFKRKVEKDVK